MSDLKSDSDLSAARAEPNQQARQRPYDPHWDGQQECWDCHKKDSRGNGGGACPAGCGFRCADHKSRSGHSGFLNDFDFFFITNQSVRNTDF